MLVLGLSPAYMILGVIVIFFIIFMYVKNIRRELYEDAQETVNRKEEKTTVLPEKVENEDEDEIELLMAAVAYYYQTK